jgi:hypothetical protein
VDTDERLSRLESQLAEYDRLISRLKQYASCFPAGRVVLKFLGIA